MSELEREYIVFELDEEAEAFQEIYVKEGPLYNILNPSSIFLFVDSRNKQIWIWLGRHADIRRKFIATQSAPNVRDKYGIDYKITAVDDGKEDLVFKVFLGL